MTHERSSKMGRQSLLVPLGLLLTFASACTAKGELPNLSLMIMVPIHDGQRTIEVGHRAAHFNVIVKNLSEHRLNLWREWCSWGYFNLSFRLTDENGITWIAKKKEKDWEKNFPDFVIVDPRDELVIDVTFDPDIWDNVLPLDAGRSMTVSMVAIYQSENSDDAKERGVWSGRLVSDEREYTLVRQNN